MLLTIVTALAIQIAVAQSPAPDFTVNDIHVTTHTLSNYLNDGKTVVLDFFFTTCPPCIQWTPQIEQMYKDFGSGQHDLIVIGIDNGDSDAEVMNFENDMGTCLLYTSDAADE